MNLLAFATFILALVTAVMAVATAYMACFTRKSILQAQRHHEESSMPILYMDIFNHEGPRSSNFITPITSVSGSMAHITGKSIFLNIAAKIVNIGHGAALDISLEIKYENNDLMILMSNQVGSISALGAKTIGRHEFRPLANSYFLDLDGNFKPEEYLQLAFKPWCLQIDYKDIYGNCYRTVHRKYELDDWINFVGRIPCQERLP